MTILQLAQQIVYEVLDLGNLLEKCHPTRSRRSRGKNNHMFSEHLEGLMLMHWESEPPQNTAKSSKHEDGSARCKT